MSKSCHQHSHHKWRKFWWRVAKYGSVVLLILLIFVLVTSAILRPRKPRFILQDATLYAFNVSSNPSLLTSTFQVTLSSSNPNDRIGIYYDRLDVYATYRDQQITLRTRIPRSYEGHKDVDVWSPFIYGNLVPIAPYNSAALGEDRSNGYIMVVIKIDGRVRWKVGSFTSGGYHIFVACPAYITFGTQSTGVFVGDNAVKYQLVEICRQSFVQSTVFFRIEEVQGEALIKPTGEVVNKVMSPHLSAFLNLYSVGNQWIPRDI